MSDQKLVNALREHAEWAEGNQWETPITLGDDLAESADLIEAQTKEIDALRNELCLKCGNYRKTRQSVFLEQWPNCIVDHDGIVGMCPRSVDKNYICDLDRFAGCRDCRREFWMQEVE